MFSYIFYIFTSGKTRSCNIQRFSKLYIIKIFIAKNVDNFLYFSSKHGLWIHVRTALNICFGAKYEGMYTPVLPSLAIYKCGVYGYTFHGHVILMDIRNDGCEEKNR